MKYYYDTKPQFLSKGIVLCQPGLWCSEETYNPMWIKLKEIGDLTTIEMNDVVLMSTNICDTTIQINLRTGKNNGKISFYKTLFTNPIGRVDDQADELKEIIDGVKNVVGNDVPIYLVGYSKGGLVNMRFVTKYPGIVTNMTSIGTPYLNSFLQRALSLADDVLGAPMFTVVNDQLVDMKKGIRTLLDQYVSDEDLGSDIFFQKLSTEWNRLSTNQKPYVTCIACSQIAFENKPTDGSDLIVSVEAQKGTGLNNINKTILISDNFEYVKHNEWHEILYSLSPAMAVEVIENITWGIGEAIKRKDIVYALFAFCLAIIPFTWDMEKYDLIHTQELGNRNVCKAVLAAINKSNPNKNGGY